MATSPIWKHLTPELAHEILCCTQDTQKKLYRASLDLMSKQMGLRASKILEMPKKDRHLVWQKLLAQGHLEAMSFNVLSNWLMQTQSAMLCAWLDQLGIPHNGKGVTDDFPPTPNPEALKAAVDHLLANYPANIVGIYLRAFNEIDGVGWLYLSQLIESDPRLALGA